VRVAPCPAIIVSAPADACEDEKIAVLSWLARRVCGRLRCLALLNLGGNAGLATFSHFVFPPLPESQRP
jgi:hypothetical protein